MRSLRVCAPMVLAMAGTGLGQEGAGESASGIEAFRGWRFGMFVHWGPVSLRGTEIGWSRGREVPAAEYDELYRRFRAEKFVANEWAEVAAAAGMKYLVITSKHHDGFSLWPSDATEYDVANTPFGRDVLAELSAACREHGLKFCTYYSLCDWYHPDYPLDSPGGRGRKAESDMPRYVEFVQHQTRELLERYGPLGVMWFDGEWEEPWTRAHGNDLYRALKEIQPDLVINNRVSKGREGMAGTTRQSSANAGDYDTPEQQVGSFQRGRPWETCMTLCRQWAWKPDDALKSLGECLHILIATLGGDGNLLLNVGPMPDGRIEPRQVERLREIGAWLEPFSEAVYGTRGGPFKPGRWGASTCAENRIYLWVERWPEEGPLVLPAIPLSITASRGLGGARPRVEAGAGPDGQGIALMVGEAERDEHATVIELTLDGPALEIEPLDVFPLGRPVPVKAARASNVFRGQPEYAAERGVDGDGETRWATDSGTQSAWLELELAEPATLGAAWISEAYAGRVEEYALEAWQGGEWVEFHRGTTLGKQAEIQFEAIEAQRVRLVVQRASEGPTIWEFQLFASPAGPR